MDLSLIVLAISLLFFPLYMDKCIALLYLLLLFNLNSYFFVLSAVYFIIFFILFRKNQKKGSFNHSSLTKLGAIVLALLTILLSSKFESEWMRIGNNSLLLFQDDLLLWGVLLFSFFLWAMHLRRNL